jgi:hypothetical protein
VGVLRRSDSLRVSKVFAASALHAFKKATGIEVGQTACGSVVISTVIARGALTVWLHGS